jgi:hypothetical protein
MRLREFVAKAEGLSRDRLTPGAGTASRMAGWHQAKREDEVPRELQESVPLMIQIICDVAIVHSLWQEESGPRAREGSQFVKGRSTNVLKQENGCWLLISAAFGPDMTGPYPYNP